MGTQNKAGRPKRDLTENVIRNAMKHTQSNFQAARNLNITIETYRKYAKLYVDQETGKNLYELHKNNSGKGIKRVKWNHEISVDKINEIMASESYRAIKMECYICKHHEKRVIDYKQPLMLSFVDGNKHNWQIDNLRMLCYNCHFLYVGDLFSEKQIRSKEDANAPLIKEEIDWEVDDNFLAHFQDLGLEKKEDYQEGDEYISRI